MTPIGCFPSVCIIALCVTFAEFSVAQTTHAEVSYVIHPLDSLAATPLFQTVFGGQGVLNLTTTSPADAAFGTGAVQVEYEAVQTEPWGGYVDFGTVASRAHNCNGATHLSIWYKVLKRQSSEFRSHLRLILLDDSDCEHPTNCTDPQELEQYYAFQYVLDGSESEWRELRVELRGDTNSSSPFFQTGWSGATGNRFLDLGHIRGWRVEINIDSQGAIGSSSSGSIALDQLACVGGGELFGAAFRIPNTSFSGAVASGMWVERHNYSDPATVSTNTELAEESLVLSYTMNHTEGSAEYVTFVHMAPDPAYYNLSQVESLSLECSMQGPSSFGLAKIQMHLTAATKCEVNCDANDGPNLAHFSSIAVQLIETGDYSNLTAALQGDVQDWTRTTGPFVSGNVNLDPSLVKGYGLSIALEEPGAIGFDIRGEVTLSNLFAQTKAVDFASASLRNIESMCIPEPEFQFDVHQEGVWKTEFATNKCCQICAVDDECLYAQADGVHCYMASRLNSRTSGHAVLTGSQRNVQAFWMDDDRKRGDFCSKCECRKQDRTIDCRGKDLAILPKSFSATDSSWSPVVLDLRENPSLVLFGTSALASISATLQELRLPSAMRHLSQDGLQLLPSLKTVTFEPFAGNDEAARNVIAEASDFFGHVCCKPGTRLDLVYPSNGLTFCNVTRSKPGIDAIYEPYLDFHGGKMLDKLKPSSDFMSEASESVEKCAAYCEIREGCRFYSYDTRLGETEPSCRLLETEGVRTQANNSGDFADSNRTRPGRISGRVPRTRNELDNARVIIASKHVAMTKESNFTATLQYSLGSRPMRGAVWIKPALAAEAEFNVTFSPQRVVLYDDLSTATIIVAATIPTEAKHGQTFHVTSEIESCDTAFASFDNRVADRMVIVDVVLQSPATASWPAFTLPFAAVLILVAAFLYVDHTKRRADSVWTIQPSELSFRNPPEELGRGTFGLVLLAEYRGTQVAVKRVLPPRGCSSHDMLAGYISTPVATHLNGRQRASSIMSCSTLENTARRRHNQLKAEFIAEMRLLTKLRHPCITTIMGAVVGRNEEPMLIMEYMDHGSLYDLLHNDTMVIEGESILPILRDIAQGVRFLHAAAPRVIHGDLKAHNILVDGKFRSKVADFGLSQKKRLGVTGTPYWMAPELLAGTSANSEATDAYSFGIILYELYSRKDPYEGEDTLDVLKLVMDPVINKRPPVPASCPSEIQSLMAACLVREPELRPSFRELDLRLKSYDIATVEPGETRVSAQFKKEKRTSTLLSDVFPAHIAAALRDGRKIEPKAHDIVTIFFSDIVGFTALCDGLPPLKVSDMLDRLYSRFDILSHEHDVFKVETIGDAYMAVTNLIKDQDDHAKRIAEFAVAAVSVANDTLIDIDDPDRGYVSIRVGFHSGPVVANVVGSRNPRYCLFGDTVNTAARMESNSAANRIQCSEAAAKLLQAQHPTMPIFARGKIEVKGKGEMFSYWVNEDHTAPEEYLSLEELAATHRMKLLASTKSTRQMRCRLGRSALRRTKASELNEKRACRSKTSVAQSDCSSDSSDWIETCSTDGEDGPL